MSGLLTKPASLIYSLSFKLPFVAALTHPGHRVIYAPGDSFPCRRDAS
ncbi:hypothetical protein [Photorhabdus heterorhabditis]|nr:hypothetical protein [Photorhabdus heterorhabditis]NRN28189.1 hypothetical protein [Photorhabdus heterorhabditis subsp. aluminescens]